MVLKKVAKPIVSFIFFQEQAKLDANKQAMSPDDCEDLSPMPPSSAPPVRRRGAFSAEPVRNHSIFPFQYLS